VGVGTYNMDLDNQTDLAMYNSIIDSVMSGGVNVIDTCASFRHTKSERVVNAAIMYLLREKGYKREQLLLGTKAGYIADDADHGTKGMELVKEIIKEGLMGDEDVLNDSHCIHPVYLELSLEKSLVNLGLSTIDIFYLNNVI
jgi:aryl-alcohol dehydrogenase-like predicted oxidoreductase